MHGRSLMIAALAATATFGSASAQDVTRRAGPQSWLGFSFSNTIIIENGARRDFAVVVDVVEDSPAQRAGIQVGDTLLSVNGLAATGELLGSLRYSVAPGDQVTLRVRRADQERELQVRAAERPPEYLVDEPEPGVFRVDPDALRGQIRILIDSTAARIDAMRTPRIVVPDDERGWIRIFGDSTIVLGDRDLRLFRNLDSLQTSLDSLFINFPRGNAMIRLDSLRGRGLVLGRDSLGLYNWLDSTRWSFSIPDSLGNLRSRMLFNFADSLGNMSFSTRGGTVLGFGDNDFVFSGPTGITMLGNRAIAGAQLAEIDTELGAYFGVDDGVLVMRVPEDTPAYRAGLRAGDVIVGANGESVDAVRDLREVLGRRRGNEVVTLDVVRHQDRITIEMRD